MANPSLSPDLHTALQDRLRPFVALDDCHREILQQLQTLTQLLQQLEGQGVDATARRQAAELMAFFGTRARQHHAEEDRVVFPPLLAAGDPVLVQQVQRLQQDHGWLEEDWHHLALQIDAVAQGYSWYDLDALRHGSEVFIALYHDHLALEETLIYPQARRALQAECEGVGRRLAARRREAATLA